MCLGAVRDVIRLTEVVARLPMVAPDDHAPDEVCADIEIRLCARALHEQAEALRADLTRALPSAVSLAPVHPGSCLASVTAQAPFGLLWTLGPASRQL